MVRVSAELEADLEALCLLDGESPAEVFRTLLTREIQRLHDDAEFAEARRIVEATDALRARRRASHAGNVIRLSRQKGT